MIVHSTLMLTSEAAETLRALTVEDPSILGVALEPDGDFEKFRLPSEPSLYVQALRLIMKLPADVFAVYEVRVRTVKYGSLSKGGHA